MSTKSTAALVERLRDVAVSPGNGWLSAAADELERLAERTPTPRRVDVAAQVMADGLEVLADELTRGQGRADEGRQALRSVAFAVEAAAHAHSELDDWDRRNKRDAAFVAALLEPVGAIETATRALESSQFALGSGEFALSAENVERVRAIFAGVTLARRRLNELAKHYDGPIGEDDEQ